MASDNGNYQPIANPYIVGNPIENRAMFFGREDDFEFIRKRVVTEEKGGLLVLCGARRSGKTSILFQIKGGRFGPEFLPVLIDMQSMTVQDDAEFLAKLAKEIIRAVGHPDISYKADYLASAVRNPFGAFQALIQVISIKMPDRKLVLMFDEYELIETYLAKGRFSPDILHLLANWMEHSGGVFIIFTGSDKLETRDKQVCSNFLGKALHRRISFLSRDDTFRLIHEPLRGIVEYAPGVAEHLYHLTAGQPFYTQVLCQALVDHLNEERKYEVTQADVDLVVAEMVENPLPQMIFSWCSLTDIEKLCLSSLAERSSREEEPQTFARIRDYPQEQKTGWRFDNKKLHETVERLFHQDLLIKAESGDSFVFKMDLWRQWVGRMHSIWQVIDEITEEGRKPEDGIRKDTPRATGRWLLSLGVILILVVYLGFHFWPQTEPVTTPGTGAIAVVQVDSGWVRIDSSPQGARAYLDNERLGETPLPPIKRPVGDHTLDLEVKGFQSRRDTVTVMVDDTLDVALILEEGMGSLTVTSSPRGALITIDGKTEGLTTPATIRDLTMRSRHSIRVTLSGYLPQVRDRIEIRSDTTETLRFTLIPVTHDLTIRSDPDSAQVVWDGSPKGPTPLVITEIREGEHSLELTLEGYQPYSTRIAVPGSGGVHSVRLELLPIAVLQFMIRPYADIYINGELKKTGVSNHRVELRQGDYRVRLEHPEFPPHRVLWQLVAGNTDTLRYDFRNPGPAGD